MSTLLYRIVPILIFGLILASCHPAKRTTRQDNPSQLPTTPPEPPAPAPQPIPQPPATAGTNAPVLRFEKKCPIGKCPDFVVEVFADGRATYFGRKNVSKTGNWQAMLPKAWLSETVSVSEAMGYGAFLEHYPANDQTIPDLPSTSIKLRLSDSRMHAVNDHFDAPPLVQSYENWLFERLEAILWHKAQGAD